MADPRRAVPRTDTVLADPRLAARSERLGRERVRSAVSDALARVRSGELAPGEAAEAALALLPDAPGSGRAVLNATGVVLHTNLGRAPLSADARAAVDRAAGYVDVEFDLATGRRARRGRGLLDALRRAVPAAEDVLVVNNGAAALLLAVTVLGGELVISRGELVEIGDGFRLPDLLVTTGVGLREVGTTNRTALRDYAGALDDGVHGILKIHPSNFRIEGFTGSVPVRELAALGVPVVADVGSGLLAPHPLLPEEPDVATALRDGAALVTCSGDKLLGGPQAGLLLGRADLIEKARRHPLARALRIDKLTAAALEATLDSPTSPTWTALTADPDELRGRAETVAAALSSCGAEVVRSDGAVGGGGAPGVVLPGWAVAVPTGLAEPLRRGEPPVVGRIEHDRLLLDLRCIPPEADRLLVSAVTAACAARS